MESAIELKEKRMSGTKHLKMNGDEQQKWFQLAFMKWIQLAEEIAHNFTVMTAK